MFKNRAFQVKVVKTEDPAPSNSTDNDFTSDDIIEMSTAVITTVATEIVAGVVSIVVITKLMDVACKYIDHKFA